MVHELEEKADELGKEVDNEDHIVLSVEEYMRNVK